MDSRIIEDPCGATTGHDLNREAKPRQAVETPAVSGRGLVRMTEDSLRRACAQAAARLLEEGYDRCRTFAGKGARESCIRDTMIQIIADAMDYARMPEADTPYIGQPWTSADEARLRQQRAGAGVRRAE